MKKSHRKDVIIARIIFETPFDADQRAKIKVIVEIVETEPESIIDFTIIKIIPLIESGSNFINSITTSSFPFIYFVTRFNKTNNIGIAADKK